MTEQNYQEFREILWQKADELFREMPWRTDTRAYYVLVSEIMLQQTQVARVKIKFAEFIARFPDFVALANAPLADVLAVWSGLGYNRRAKFLHEAAKQVVERFNGELPSTHDELVSLPGIGVNTAGAILAYSFNQPSVFIETNVRTVLFQHFFEGQESVTDREVKMVLEHVVDPEHPREFYWAMMDYGSWLKKQGVGANSQSKHYKKQSALKGSVREVRGIIVKVLAQQDVTEPELKAAIESQTPLDARYESALAGLIKDGLVESSDGRFHLTR